MGILNDFERRLEGLIEGVFTKAFRTGVHPVELANRIVREMEVNKSIGVREVWVPNRFVFRLSEPDHERFEQTEKALRRELEQVVREGAAERGWRLVGPPEVLFALDTSLSRGEYACEATLVEGPTGPQPVPTAARAPGDAGDGRRAGGAVGELVLLERGRAARAFLLDKDHMSIGRLDDADVTLEDPGVSRRHAEVRREGDHYVLRDLGSTNGTMVNESVVTEHALEPGDRITLGRTVLEFRRR